MNRTSKTLNRILIAWFVALLVYGFIKFPDAPYKRCSVPEGYCGKGGTPHTRSEHEALEIWEKTLFGSAVVGAAINVLIGWPRSSMARSESIPAPARSVKWRDQPIASFRKRRIEAIRLYSVGGFAAVLAMAGALFAWPVWLICTFVFVSFLFYFFWAIDGDDAPSAESPP